MRNYKLFHTAEIYVFFYVRDPVALYSDVVYDRLHIIHYIPIHLTRICGVDWTWICSKNISIYGLIF